jgi:hypothetical protein
VFFIDRGKSRGMALAAARCDRDRIPLEILSLADVNALCWEEFQRGEWPPHTPGFALLRPDSRGEA